MSRNKIPTWRITRIPYRIVKRLYGSNADNAGDDIREALQQVSEYPGQYRTRFDSDIAHPNPWYHTLVFEIEGISDSAYEQFREKLTSLGLIETSGTDT